MSQSDGLIGHSEQAPEPEGGVGGMDAGLRGGGGSEADAGPEPVCVHHDLHTGHTPFPDSSSQATTPPHSSLVL